MGTILASTKLPLRTWFLAMYLMTQTKNGISTLELSRQFSVSYNIAWKVKHKLMQVMKERDDTRPLGGWVQLDDAYWGGQRHGGKSGRGAPGKTPFVTGSGPDSAQHPALIWFNTILGNVKRSFHGTYHHFSSKHLPRYLAEFSYRFSRRFSLREIFPHLAFVALRTAPMPYRVLKLAENYF